MIDWIEDQPGWDGGEGLLAFVIRNTPQPHGTHFLTEPSLPQQVATIRRNAGHIIPAHIHTQIERRVTITQETLFVRGGKVKVKFFTSARDYVGERVLTTGDVVVLLSGGHSVEFLEESELIEIKTGPYLGERDKVWFGSADEGAVSAT